MSENLTIAIAVPAPRPTATGTSSYVTRAIATLVDASAWTFGLTSALVTLRGSMLVW